MKKMENGQVDKVFVVPSKGLRPPELHIAVWHAAHPDICDACSLKAYCHELFDNGNTCRIHANGERWHKVKPREQLELKRLLMDIEEPESE